MALENPPRLFLPFRICRVIWIFNCLFSRCLKIGAITNLKGLQIFFLILGVLEFNSGLIFALVLHSCKRYVTGKGFYNSFDRFCYVLQIFKSLILNCLLTRLLLNTLLDRNFLLDLQAESANKDNKDTKKY